MSFQQQLNNINPKKLFLIDSLGALLSSLILSIILTKFENTIGMPHWSLYFLSLIAFIFSAYSIICFLIITENWRTYMRIIAIANLIYVCVSIGLIIYMYQNITFLGFIYFAFELIIIITLVIVELKTASN